MAPYSSTLAWKIPWTEEPGRLQSMGSLRVRHDWVASLSLSTFMHWRRKWQPTPVFLPGESQGRGSLVGCCLWGCTELDTTEAAAAYTYLSIHKHIYLTIYTHTQNFLSKEKVGNIITMSRRLEYLIKDDIKSSQHKRSSSKSLDIRDMHCNLIPQWDSPIYTSEWLKLEK